MQETLALDLDLDANLPSDGEDVVRSDLDGHSVLFTIRRISSAS
jgi:hypothetical protein